MNEPIISCTVLLMLATGVCSFFGFRSYTLAEKYLFNPERILADKEYYRLVSSAFLHADWRHLLLNLFSLYFFGSYVELVLGKAQFLLIYFGAVIGGDLLSLYVHRMHDYRSYGASGGVCGLIFAYILISPGGSILVPFVPIGIPGWLYAIGFILGSFYGMKEHNRGNIGHDAHLGGAVVGLLIAAALNPELVRENPKVFLLILGLAVLLLVYLWYNPLFLPVAAFFHRGARAKRRASSSLAYKRESAAVDEILEKIATRGFDSLTPEEKNLLGQVSGKYQRRAESKKPQSGLAI
jgi:membrane associated rhomboid family serine protease